MCDDNMAIQGDPKCVEVEDIYAINLIMLEINKKSKCSWDFLTTTEISRFEFFFFLNCLSGPRSIL